MANPNPTMQRVEKALEAALNKNGGGPFTVEARTSNDSAVAGAEPTRDRVFNLTLRVGAEGAETDPAKYEKIIAGVLGDFAPLKPYVDFTLPEPETQHLDRLGATFGGIREKAAAAGLSISDAYAQWIEERRELEKLKETNGYKVEMPRDHAIRGERDESTASVTARFAVPSGVSVEDAKKMVTGRLDEFKATLARMAAKKLAPGDVAEQALIIQKVKALDVTVEADGFNGWNNISVVISSPGVAEARKQQGGLRALDAEALKKLQSANPLLLLKEDLLTPDLQKTLARAILFEGERAEKPVALFSKVAGPLDVKAAIQKTLRYIKREKPELAADVDAIMNDPLFNDQWRWGATKNADGTPKKAKIRIGKTDLLGDYTPGQMIASLPIPADKLPEVLEQLAALDTPAQVANPAAAILAQGPKDPLKVVPKAEGHIDQVAAKRAEQAASASRAG